jgi:hypothetical protein
VAAAAVAAGKLASKANCGDPPREGAADGRALSGDAGAWHRQENMFRFLFLPTHQIKCGFQIRGWIKVEKLKYINIYKYTNIYI